MKHRFSQNKAGTLTVVDAGDHLLIYMGKDCYMAAHPHSQLPMHHDKVGEVEISDIMRCAPWQVLSLIEDVKIDAEIERLNEMPDIRKVY